MPVEGTAESGSSFDVKMTRGKGNGSQKKILVGSTLVLVMFCAFMYVYSWKDSSSTLEYGSKSLRNSVPLTRVGGDDNVDESSFKLGEDGKDGIMLKSIRVSFSKLRLL